MKGKDTPAFALDQTLSAYGIRKLPFPIDEVDDYYFATPALAKQSDALRNLVEYSDLVLVVSGVEGAGKTAFLNQFLLAADARWRIARIDAREAMSLGELVEALLAGFGLAGRGEDTPGDEAVLRTFLTEVNAGGNVALVVVDDAHLLPQICIEFLVTLAEERGRIDVRLLLATEPGRLGFPTDDPKRVHVVVLKPFDAQQCADYIHTRLSYAGLVGDSPFDEATIDAIHQDSGGVPGAIHPLAIHTLLANGDAPGGGLRGALRPRNLAYAAALLLAIGAAAWVLGPGPAAPPRSAATADAGPVRGRVEGLPEAREAADPGAPQEVPEAAAPFVASVTPRAPGPSPDAGAPEAARKPGATAPGLEERPAPVRTAAAVTSPAKAPAAAERSAPEVRLAANATPAESAPGTGGPRDLAWLRTQDPRHYVIQLVGTRNRAAAGRFLDTHRLGERGAWFATTHQGQPWYVVVYGVYPDRAAARAAIEDLPAVLRAGSPWPRSVASIVQSAR